MKKNTKTYLLLIIVVTIWGVIGYRVLGSLSSDPESEAISSMVNFKPIVKKERDTFSISANYRDPFLGTLAKKKKKKVIRTTKSKIAPEPEIIINYTGFVNDRDSSKKIFFITIAGKQYLMGINDEIEKVKLISGSATSIRVRHNKKIRTISIKK